MEAILMYSIMVYGLTVLLVEGLGPYHIIDKFRAFMGNLSPMLGEMLECFLCTSTNIGWIVVLMEYLLDFKISPVSLFLSSTSPIIVAVCNMFFTCGVVWIFKNVVSLLEKKSDLLDQQSSDEE